MKIPFVDIKTQYEEIKESIDSSISKVLKTGAFIKGDEVKEFESTFAKYVDAKYCISMNSGTDAIILGMRALKLPKDSEVLIPANTFIATALGASENGLKPVFVDIDPHDYGINLVDLEKKITKKTTAIILVHLYGQPDKIDEVKKIIRRSGRKIHLIEDAAQAHGALYKNKKVGTLGSFSIFSFYPGKNLGAYGDGGAVVTNKVDLAHQISLLKEYGQVKKYYHEILGVNTRLDTIQAAVLLTKLKYLDSWNKKRRDRAQLYTKLLNAELPEIVTPEVFTDRKSVYHLYVVQAPKRDKLLEYLNENGVQALIHYPIPLHLQKAYKYLGYKKGSLPITEKVSKNIISLPIFPELTNKQIEYIIDLMKKFYAKN